MPDPADPSPAISPPALAMRTADRVAERLGVTIVEAGDGHSVVTMTADADTDNGMGICHGGLLFTLADIAMAYASNGGDQRAVATGGSVEFLAAVAVGTALTATCSTPHRTGRSRVHDIEVVDDTGTVCVVFRGRTLARGPHEA